MEALLSLIAFVGAHPALEVSIFTLLILAMTFSLDWLMASQGKKINYDSSALLAFGSLLFTTGLFIFFKEAFGLPLIDNYGNVSIAIAVFSIANKRIDWVTIACSVVFFLVTLYLFFDVPNYGAFVEQYIVPQTLFLVFGTACQKIANNIGGQMAVLWGNRPQE